MYEAKVKTLEGKTQHIVLERVLNIEEANQIAKSLCGVEEVLTVYLSRYKEVYYDTETPLETATKWYEATLEYETEAETKEDGKATKPKTTKHKILVEATSFEHCYDRMKNILKQGYEMDQKSLKETNIAYVLQDVIADMDFPQADESDKKQE